MILELTLMVLRALMQTLDIRSVNGTLTGMLHDLENTGSRIVVSIFWTRNKPNAMKTHRTNVNGSKVGNIPPENGMAMDDNVDPPILLQGNAIMTQTWVRARLEVAAGLAAAIGLLILSLPSSILDKGTKFEEAEDVNIDGSGLLHAIWLYRHPPELEKLLEQVEHPTEDNLRAGMRIAPQGWSIPPGYRGGLREHFERILPDGGFGLDSYQETRHGDDGDDDDDDGAFHLGQTWPGMRPAPRLPNSIPSNTI
ncbi:hypothetical protein DFH09DRAFT_1098385 [Mycena vulgaris]|nr:hypothetical protein DFH09DRAFT_1098385 [Mycena vulgaris]